MTMNATVLETQCCSLLVCDSCTLQRVLVRTRNASSFCPGDQVRIRYCGAMTMSIPPQINAACVTRLPVCGC